MHASRMYRAAPQARKEEASASSPSQRLARSFALGAHDDAPERVADAMADRLVPGAGRFGGGSRFTPMVGSTSASATGTVPSELAERLDQEAHGSGVPLDASARAALEPRFGFDFAKVRVHSDAA